MKKNYNYKKIILIAILSIIFIEVCIIVCLNLFNNNDYKKVYNDDKGSINELSDEQKKILDIDESDEEKEKNSLQKEIEDKATTDEFKLYDNLSDEEKAEIDIVPRKDVVVIEELDDSNEDNNDISDQDEIPARFDLRDYMNLKVEDQESLGLCWAFASLNTLETYLYLHENVMYDFSEIHLDYIESNLMYGWRTVHDGGHFSYFADYMTVSGPILEKNTFYGDLTEDVYKEFVNTDSNIIVTKTISFPAIKKGTNSTSEEDTQLIRNSIKKHIMKNGAVYAVINTKKVLNQFSTQNFFGNHAITIIGWDDNYSKDNFVDYQSDGEKIVPEHDGAYIALNSWGEFFGENGFFYISYDDYLVETDVNGILSTSIEDAHKVSDIKSDIIREYIINNFQYAFINYHGEDYVTDLVLDKVTLLDLSNMNLTNDDLEDIGLFSKIYTLDLSNNQISDLTNLPKLNRLLYLNLSNNKIDNIDSLNQFANIDRINLSSNNLQDISFLSTLKNAQWVILDDNKISDISVLNDCLKLTYVSLKNNGIKDISMLNNDSITDLILDGNKGIKGYDGVNVYTLSLNDCDIKELPNLSNNDLEYLKLANNPDIVINEGYLPSSLIYIDLSNNNLDNIEFLSNTKYLTSLTLVNNNIKSLKGLYGGEDSYLNIDVSQNPLEDINELNNYLGIIMKYSNNESVDLSIFDDLENINILELKNNNIKDLSMLKIKSVYSLDLSENMQMTNLDALIKIENLNDLILNKCNISDITDIAKMKNLLTLELSYNNIINVDELNNLEKLESLSLANNSNLSGELSLNTLSILNLSNTNISNTNLFKKLSNLEYVNLSKNDLSYDELYEFHQTNQISQIILDNDEEKNTVDIETVIDFLKEPYLKISGIDYIDIHLNGQNLNNYLSDKWFLKAILMKFFHHNGIIINGYIDKRIKNIYFNNINEPVIIQINGYRFRIYQ